VTTQVSSNRFVSSHRFQRLILLHTIYRTASSVPAGGEKMDQQITDAELKDMFTLFDQNNSGYIESFELRNILQAMGQNPTQKDVDTIIQEADVLVKDGKIDFDEFARIMRTNGTFKSSNEMDDELMKAFEMFDRDKNGYISRQELEFVLKSIGEPMSYEEIDEMFKKFVVMFNHSFKGGV
uniref:Calmodulin n=1 Tax=Macrostomum lignano TaxID=282301 RepID=A0A1I8HV68_9PLAT